MGEKEWRPKWREAEREGASIVEFLANEYSSQMASIGYLPMALDDMIKVRTTEKRLPLYYLSFFSKNKKGLDFWNQVKKYASDQLSLQL